MYLVAFLLMLATPPASLPADVQTRLDAVVDDPEVRVGTVGAFVGAMGTHPLETPKDQLFRLTPYPECVRPALYDRNPLTPVRPASNNKIFTVAAALDRLGPDYTWTTRVKTTARPHDGLVGDLYLIGGGDPALDYDDLHKIAEQIKAAGVSSVDGAVICDGSRFTDKIGWHWAEGDLPWYYAAEVSGIALERNFVQVTVKPGDKVGAPARVSIDPGVGVVAVHNHIVTDKPGTKAEIDWGRDLKAGDLILTGHVPADPDAEWGQGVAIPGVPRYAAKALTKMLKDLGVSVHGEPQEGRAPAAAKFEITRFKSQTLAQVMVPLMKRSDILFAEMFNRELGLVESGVGSAAAGCAGVMRYLAKEGIDRTNVSLVDGSGLSDENHVTAQATASVLCANALAKTRTEWYNALPIGAVNGSLYARFKGTKGERNVHAKPGYIWKTTGLSGYVTNQSGDLLVVSTYFNDYAGTGGEARGLHDKFFTALADWKR